MARTAPYTRCSWEDRFNQPTLKQLRAGLPARARPVFDRARRRLLDLSGVTEALAWHGESWKWTIEYRVDQADEPLAVVVPSPSDLQLAVPLDREFVNALSIKRMKRAVRDGLELALEPFDTRWGIWSITALSLVDDLQHLIESKLGHLGQGKAAG